MHLGLDGDGQAAWNPDAPVRTDTENAIAINEIMPNPSGSDGGKEWFELYNRWFTPLHLKDWTILGAGANESHVLASDLEIAKGNYGLLGQTLDSTSNGGYVPDYAYGTTVSLSNFGETLTILNGSGAAVDSVPFGSSFPFSSGVSMELIRPDYNNNDSTSWLAAGLSYGNSGNMGTPGMRNAAFSGTIALNNTGIDYGYVTEGAEAQLSVTVYNQGVADLVLSSIVNETETFSLSPNQATIAPNDSIDIFVTFLPQTVQVYHDTITILSDDPYNPVNTVILTGSAINEFADIVVQGNSNDSLFSYQFPFTRLGFSRTLQLSVVNIGTPNLEIEEIILEGDPEFSVDTDAAILSFMDTLLVSVVYTPTEEGTNSATLTFGSNDPDEPTYTLALSGQAAENIILYVPSEYPTISAAIDSAFQQDTIEVATGTYEESVTLLDKNLVFRGSGRANETILQGDGTGPVLTVSGGQNSTTIISHFMIIGGGGTQGGGIKIDGSSTPVLHHLILAANAVSGNGGGIAILSGGADVSFTSISNNTAGGNGGALYAAASASVVLNHSILWGNGNTEIGSFGNVATSYSIVGGGVEGTGNLDLDPLFVNGPSLDFSLQWESFGIDGGDPAGELNQDGTVADMGALDYDQSFQPPDPVVAFSGVGGNGFIDLSWSEPVDPRGSPNEDVLDYTLLRATGSGLFDTLAVLATTETVFQDQGDTTHLINGQDYHYVLIPRDTSDLYSTTNDTLDLLPVGGSIAVDDSVQDFGSIDHDQSSVWAFIIGNTGNGVLTLDSLFTSSAWYSVSEPTMTIPADSSDTLLVLFQPDLTAGSLTDTLVIETNDLDVPEIQISLSGTSSWPILELSDSELAYGNIRVDQVELLSVIMSNSGTDTLFVDSVYIADTLSGFSVNLSENNTSRAFVNRFVSKFPGKVNLLGKKTSSKIKEKSVSRSSGKNQFPVKAQTVSQTRPRGYDPSSNMNKPEIIQGTEKSGYNASKGLGRSGVRLVSNAILNSVLNISTEVLPGESIGLDISFSRSDTATVNTALEITSDDPLGNGDLSISLAARSVAPVLSLSSSEFSFGNTLADSSHVFTLSNTGSDTLNITELIMSANVYTQALSDSVLEPGATAELNVLFNPDLDGYYTGDLEITSDTYLTGTSSIALSGSKAGAASL